MRDVSKEEEARSWCVQKLLELPQLHFRNAQRKER